MTLHVTNGDGAGSLIAESGLAGEVLPWRDPMHHGPFPPGASLEELAGIRALHLAGDRLDPSAVRADILARDARLRAAVADGEEIVLWFEHDLLDQLQVLQILDSLAGWAAKAEPLSVIALDRYPGIEPFRGLGQLSPGQMADLHPRRVALDPDLPRRARLAWSVFRAPDPRPLVSLAQRGVEGLPFLGPALKRHCEEYPWTRDGLTRSERLILTLVAEGLDRPGPLFQALMDRETVFFPGDWFTFDRVAQLCEGTDPLLAVDGGSSFIRLDLEMPPSEDFRAQRLALTDRGRRALAGEAHPRWPRDEWLGGVHVTTAEPHWCWDGLLERLVAFPALSA